MFRFVAITSYKKLYTSIADIRKCFIMLDVAFESIVFGFSMYSLFFLVAGKRRVQSGNSTIAKIDGSATLLVRLAGLMYTLGFVVCIVAELLFPDSETQTLGLTERMFGKYWFGFWFQPIVIFSLTQLFWIRRIKYSRRMKLMIAILLFLPLYMEKIVIFLTSLHHDFLPGSWDSYSVNTSITAFFILNCIVQCGIFALLVGSIYVVRYKVFALPWALRLSYFALLLNST